MKARRPFARGSGYIAALLLVGSLAGSCAASAPASVSASGEDLLGTWSVDLRPTPSADPYYQAFVVTSVDGSTFSGTFYGAEISEARLNTDWGKLRLAFVTADGSGAYHHSAVLDGDRLEGLSNSTGRGFLAYWSAVRQ